MQDPGSIPKITPLEREKIILADAVLAHDQLKIKLRAEISNYEVNQNEHSAPRANLIDRRIELQKLGDPAKEQLKASNDKIRKLIKRIDRMTLAQCDDSCAISIQPTTEYARCSISDLPVTPHHRKSTPSRKTQTCPRDRVLSRPTTRRARSKNLSSVSNPLTTESTLLNSDINAAFSALSISSPSIPAPKRYTGTKGEIAVEKCLEALGHAYLKEYSPSWITPRRYDFGLCQEHIIIEFDGIQHFEYNAEWDFGTTATELNKIKAKDADKMIKAIVNGFKILRIHYSFLEECDFEERKVLISRGLRILKKTQRMMFCIYPRQPYEPLIALLKAKKQQLGVTDVWSGRFLGKSIKSHNVSSNPLKKDVTYIQDKR